MERIARDAGVSAADLSILAGKWPDAADLLYRRMNEIKLDRMEVTHADPQVMRESSARMHGLWKQTAVRARARKESVRFGKNIARTLRRSRHWPLRELPEPGRIRWYENRLVASEGSSSRWAPFFH